VPTPATAATPPPSGATVSVGAANSADKQQAVEECKRLQAPPTIGANAKINLAALCEKVASGDPTAPHKVLQELCVAFVNASPAPAGEAKERALARCSTV
jgi:hypothetical protein